MKIFTSIMIAFLLLSFGQIANAQEDYDFYLQKALQRLKEGDCFRAKQNYNIYKDLTNKIDRIIELQIEDCQSGVPNYFGGDQEEAVFARCCDIDGCESYLQSYPDGKYSKEASIRKSILRIEEMAGNRNKVSVYFPRDSYQLPSNDVIRRIGVIAEMAKKEGRWLHVLGASSSIYTYDVIKAELLKCGVPEDKIILQPIVGIHEFSGDDCECVVRILLKKNIPLEPLPESVKSQHMYFFYDESDLFTGIQNLDERLVDYINTYEVNQVDVRIIAPLWESDSISQKRVTDIENHLWSLLKVGMLCDQVSVNVFSESPDWDEFITLVQNSIVTDKDQIIRVINNADSQARREQEIKNMINVYPELERDICPLLRRIEIGVK